MDSQAIVGALWFLIIAAAAGYGYLNPVKASGWIFRLYGRLGFKIRAERQGIKTLQVVFGFLTVAGIVAAGAILCMQ